MQSVTADHLAAALRAAERPSPTFERSHADVVAAARDANADDEHDPEGATIAFEREQLAALRAQAAAGSTSSARRSSGSRTGGYGRCERCGQPIGAARLAVRPAARTCIACAARR